MSRGNLAARFPASGIPPALIAKPVMRQSWLDLTFIHWRYNAATIRSLIPPGLELDSFDGACWVGLVPFRIVDVSFPYAPAVPWLSSFPETNVRTYVVDASGQPGVWFFSLDAARLLAVAAARLVYGLPYVWANMSVKTTETAVRYRSHRVLQPELCCEAEVELGEAVETPDRLTAFLTARFRLYAERNGRLLTAPIYHLPWPLQKARLNRLQQNLVQAAGLPAPYGDPLVHFSRRVDVLVGKSETR
jgi:uncharacterized protein